MNILLVQTVLDKYKVVSDVAYDGQQAFELFEKNSYDLVLTDIEMPVMNGIKLSNAIRSYKDISKQHIPIFALTANVLPEDRDLYLDAGINHLVLKPFTEKDLMDKIATQLAP